MLAEEGRGVLGQGFETDGQVVRPLVKGRVSDPLDVAAETSVLRCFIERVTDDAEAEERVFEVLVVGVLQQRRDGLAQGRKILEHRAHPVCQIVAGGGHGLLSCLRGFIVAISEYDVEMVREFLRGAVKVHVLHHAAESGVYGAWLADELARHGYAISPGTLYPMLHRMEQSGLLNSRREVVDGRVRRVYSTTKAGNAELAILRTAVAELAEEVLPDVYMSEVSRWPGTALAPR